MTPRRRSPVVRRAPVVALPAGGGAHPGAGAGSRIALLACAALAGCRGELSTLDPAGPAAAHIDTLWWVMLAGAVAILAFVLVLLGLAFRRGPRREVDERRWTHGLGLGFSLAVLGALLGWGLVVGERLLPRAGPEVVRVEATAHRWSWRFRQPGPDGRTVETVNRLYVPAGTPVDVVLRSDDVIHSFWVPRLGGKMDAIPGKTNVLRIEADRPGEYVGVCAEYCGVEHARHGFVVVAYAPGSWLGPAEPRP